MHRGAVAVAALIAIISITSCDATNYLVQTNVQNSESGNDLQASSGEVCQEVYNHAGVLESGNSINQINDQSQSGFDVDQYSRNVMAMAGVGNTLSQTNLAGEAWGSNIDQSQKNLMGALGCGNRKTQMNSTNSVQQPRRERSLSEPESVQSRRPAHGYQ